MNPNSCQLTSQPDETAIVVREGEPGAWVAVPNEHGHWLIVDLLAVDATSLDDFTIDTAETWLKWALKKLNRKRHCEIGAAR